MDSVFRWVSDSIARCGRTSYMDIDIGKEMLNYQNKRLTCIKVSEEKGYEMRIYECAKDATTVQQLSFSVLKSARSF